MSSNPAVLTSLQPGANYTGSSVAVPTSPITPGGGTTAIGGGSNPFLPALPSGQTAMPMTTTAGSMPANTGTGPGATNPTVGALPNFAPGSPQANAVYRSLMSQGIPSGIASLITQFLGSGAGYNPDVAKALIAQMQPSIERGREDIVEQFSAMGDRFGSPAAVGIADYGSRVDLNIGELLSSLYEQSVQDYMSVLMGVDKPKKEGGGILGTLSQILGLAGQGANTYNAVNQLPGVNLG